VHSPVIWVKGTLPLPETNSHGKPTTKLNKLKTLKTLDLGVSPQACQGGVQGTTTFKTKTKTKNLRIRAARIPAGTTGVRFGKWILLLINDFTIHSRRPRSSNSLERAPHHRTGGRVGSGMKRPQEIECRFRGNTSLSTPTPTSEVNPTPNPRRPGPDPPSRRLRVDERHSSHAEQSTVQTLECQTLKVREMFRRSFVTSLLGNRDDQGGFDRRAGAALTASVPIQQDRANSQSNVKRGSVRADARRCTASVDKGSSPGWW